METLSGLAAAIDAADIEARYDAAAKKLIGYKAILAWILKECVEEFKGYSARYIMENCIEAEPDINIIPVHQDEGMMLHGDERVGGRETESASHREGIARYDIRFDALVPGTGECIRLIVNVEIQVKANPGYPIVTRGIYYGSRLISSQRGTVFTGENYQKIQKVYSIWICPDPLKRNQNTIARYGITEKEFIRGAEKLQDDVPKKRKLSEKAENASQEDKKHYDKMEVIVISLNDGGKDEDIPIIRLLSTLLSASETIETKKKILEDEFNIEMTSKLSEEVTDVCNLSQGIKELGIAEGIEQGISQGISQGWRERENSLAEEMIINGEPVQKIMQYSKKSLETLKEMAKKLNKTLVM